MTLADTVVAMDAKIARLERINAYAMKACKELIAHLEDDGHPLGGDTAHLDRAIELAVIAIAKAKEQQCPSTSAKQSG